MSWGPRPSKWGLHSLMKISTKHLHRRYFRLEIVLLAITIALYIPRLSDSLWLDEFAATDAVSRGFWDAASFLWFNMFPAPIFYALEWVAVQLLGHGEVALRILPFIFTVASGVALYVLTRKMTRSYEIAWASALIFLNLPLIRDQGVTARPYPLSVFCCIVSFYFLYFNQDGLRRILIAALLAAVAVYGHLLMLVMPPALALAALLRGRISYMRMGHYCVAVVIFTVPLFFHSLALWNNTSSLYGNVFYVSSLFVYINLLPILLISIVFLLRKSWLTRFCHKSRARRVSTLYPMLMCSATLPLVMILLVAYLSSANFTPYNRYLIGVRPFFAISLALIVLLPVKRAMRRALLIGLLIFLICSPCSRVFGRESPHDFRALAKHLISERKPGEPVILFSCWVEGNNLAILNDKRSREWFLLPLTYYGVSENLVLLPSYPFLPFYPTPEAREAFILGALEPLVQSGRRWLIVSCYDVASLNPFLRKLGKNDLSPKLLSNQGMVSLYEARPE